MSKHIIPSGYICKAFKTELVADGLESYFKKCLYVNRIVHNWALEERIKLYKDGKQKTDNYKQSNILTLKKKTDEYIYKNTKFSILNEVDSWVAISALKDVQDAYRNFFGRCKKGDKKKGFPKFKRYNKINSFKIHYNGFKVYDNKVKLPKIGEVGLKEKLYIPTDAKVNSITISQEAGRWFISVQCEVKDDYDKTLPTQYIGIDLGRSKTNVMSCYDGSSYTKIANPNFDRSVDKLKIKKEKVQKVMSNKGNIFYSTIFVSLGDGLRYKDIREELHWSKLRTTNILNYMLAKKYIYKSGNRYYKNDSCKLLNSRGRNLEKEKLKLQKIEKKLKDKRKDFYHKITTKIVDENSYIGIEDLKVSDLYKINTPKKKSKKKPGQKKKKGLSAKKKKNRRQQEASFGELRRMLEYKSKLSGRNLAAIDQKSFPTSKTCHVCGYVNKKMKLTDRTYKCEKCGLEIDRDENASHNNWLVPNQLMTEAGSLSVLSNAHVNSEPKGIENLSVKAMSSLGNQKDDTSGDKIDTQVVIHGKARKFKMLSVGTNYKKVGPDESIGTLSFPSPPVCERLVGFTSKLEPLANTSSICGDSPFSTDNGQKIYQEQEPLANRTGEVYKAVGKGDGKEND